MLSLFHTNQVCSEQSIGTLGEMGFGYSGRSPYLQPMCHGFVQSTQCHMKVTFVDSVLCTKSLLWLPADFVFFPL